MNRGVKKGGSNCTKPSHFLAIRNFILYFAPFSVGGF